MSKEDHDKMKFKVDGYEYSEAIDIRTIGLVGRVLLNSESKGAKEKLDQLQFGVSIMQSNYPFAKTVMITIVPRYLIINKLTYPVKVR